MDPEHARQLLLHERERIAKTLAPLERDESNDPTITDPADRASDTYDAELNEGIADELRAELAAVERAEQRLAEGTYGLSIESGVRIPDERLEALPTAERTTEEQERFDRSA
jgi:RNA polymerase-binding transcription factor